MMEALLKEIELVASPPTSRSIGTGSLPALAGQALTERGSEHPDLIETIYFGGGTPSLLQIEDCKLLIDGCRSIFSVTDVAEITIETNPDDITEEKLLGWKDAGINRLSIGIQSFYDEDLIWMNRAHNANQAISSLQLAVKYFNNITIDLIYGTPLLTDEKWKENVDMVINFGIPHISCYALTVEPKTPLDKLIKQKQKEDIDPEKQARHFLLLMDWLDKAGYEHYEISNFAKPGMRSRHNSSYWSGKNYIGIGPSAHSYNGESRQWNIANNQTYIESIQKGIIPFEKEILTATQKLNEYIMTSLRTIEGLDLRKVKSTEIKVQSQKYIAEGKMIEENNFLKLTREGKLFADGIAAELFY